MRVAGRHRTLFVIYFAALVGVLIAVAKTPVAFQKTNSMAAADFSGKLANVSSDRIFDVSGLISGIPYVEKAQMIWEVDPEEKYDRTIGAGEGNCSNLIFGLAYFLEQQEIDFHVVHLMDPETFLFGHGHTVVRVNYEYEGETRLGIVDVRDAGLPKQGDRFLDLPDLAAGSIPDFTIESLNSTRDFNLSFYNDKLDVVVLGLIPAEEIESYFSFLERIYIPFGHARVEKYFYDGLAVVLGMYPTIYVEEIERARRGNEGIWLFERIALWVFRSAFIVFPLMAWLEIRDLRRPQRSATIR